MQWVAAELVEGTPAASRALVHAVGAARCPGSAAALPADAFGS